MLTLVFDRSWLGKILPQRCACRKVWRFYGWGTKGAWFSSKWSLGSKLRRTSRGYIPWDVSWWTSWLMPGPYNPMHSSECKWKLVFGSLMSHVSVIRGYIYIFFIFFLKAFISINSCRMLFEWCGLHLRYLECIIFARLMFCEFKAIGVAALCSASTVWCFFWWNVPETLVTWWSPDPFNGSTS